MSFCREISLKGTRNLCIWLVIFLCSQAVVLAAGPGFSIEPAITPQGNPIFPIGWWYNVQRWYNIQTNVQELDAAWAQMAAGGADTLYIANGPNFNTYNHNLYLSYAAKYGLKLIFMIFRDDLQKIDDPLWGESQMATIIATIESDLQHPNFLGYSLGDELRDCDGPSTGYVSHAQQQWMMDRVKERNANVMVLQSFGATQPLHDPGDGCSIEGRVAISDTLAFFRYPFALCVPLYYPVSITNNLLCINNLARDSGGLVVGRRGLFNVGQGVGDDWNSDPDPFAPCGMRYPVYGELRYDQWAGVAVNRQRGAIYFEFGALPSPQGWVDHFNNIMTPLMQEQGQLKHAMETGWDVGTVVTNGDAYLWSGGPTVRQVGSLLVYDADALKYYLILTNNRDSTNTVSVSISNLPTTLSSMTATLLNENGTGKDTVTMSTGQQQGEYTFSISMSKYDVDIYQISGTGSNCVPALQTDINGDCKVDFKDFAVLASEWMHCNWSNQNLCN
ncbi:MAG: hypothetical protein ACYC54_07355 [Sedimentisphaerales bacterium]